MKSTPVCTQAAPAKDISLVAPLVLTGGDHSARTNASGALGVRAASAVAGSSNSPDALSGLADYESLGMAGNTVVAPLLLLAIAVPSRITDRLQRRLRHTQ